ncbi:MAG: prepilin-type N-terminal cleavage/methylation domain-containing protein [Candidatus Pacebacteria bacterium]|nr:prepilin-type N-terminal cleavage/methylation domain-containing protein [Candidatus Paceibacterota bacterium]
MKKNKSFTLIEILVAIIIIGLLAGVIMIAASASINEAKDATRREDLGGVSRGLMVYETSNGSYPALTCKIEGSQCLASFVPKYFSILPSDPVSGSYAYSSTGSEFMLLAKGSGGPISFTDSNGFDGSIVANSGYYNFKNKINTSSTSIAVNDSANGALWGYVNNFTVGWTSRIDITSTTKSYGFEAGDYDIYIRIRTDGLGSRPNYVSFGVYNSTALNYNMPTKSITGLSTSYSVKYAGRITVSEANLSENVYAYFSSSGVTTNYYLDYVEFRKV